MACEFFLGAVTNAVGTLLVDYVVKPIERRVRYLFRLNKIAEELQEQESNLKSAQTRVQRKVDEAKLQPRTEVIEEDVKDWLRKAENVLNDVQSLNARIQENKRCFRWCPNWSWRCQLSNQIEKRTRDIKKLVGSSNFERYGHRADLPAIEFLGSEGYLASKSAIDAFKMIMEALKEDGVNMIGVWGMGGVGKTTLVREVGKEAVSSHLFNQVIKVVVSQTPDIGKIQDRIAELLDFQFTEKTEVGKVEELGLQLKNREKVLIILDDMWNELNLKKIGIPLVENCTDCKIILTTCQRQVCESMESQAIVKLGVFDESEAWTVFKMNAKLDNASQDVIDVAEQVAKECGGLPIAVVTLAKALKSKDLNEWELARQKLESPRLMDIEGIPKDEQKNAYLCLEMSYSHLGTEMTKRCFLVCALYPEDYSIDAEDLVRYAWGLKLYQNADSIQEVRSEVLEAINNLKDCCLLLEADDKSKIKVHDMVHDVALWIASQEDNGLVITKSKGGSENESSKQKLGILLLNNYDSKTPIGLFEGMQKLKVLRVKGVSESNDGFFSMNTIKSLTNLQALLLEDIWQLEDISVVAKLTKLEILYLRDCGVQESVDKLRELKNLRLLDITDCGFKYGFPPKLIQKLVNLEEIYLDYSSKQRFRAAIISTALILPELNFLPRLTALLLEVPFLHVPQGFVFPRLTKYSIAIKGGSSNSSKAIMSRSLAVSKEYLPLNVFSELFRNVEFLQAYGIMEKDIKCLTDRTPWNVPVATILQNMKTVRIEDCMNLQVIFQMKKVEKQVPVLSKLKDLRLSRLPGMEYIWKMPTQHLSLKSLKVVKIDGCGKLKSLFPFSIAQSLVCLEKLEINGCGELKQIVEELKDDEQEISPKPLCLPKLRSLEISYCNSLEYIFPDFMAPLGLPQLQKLIMMDLSQLKHICRPTQQREENGFLTPQLQLLPSLTELKLTACPELTEVHSKPEKAYLEKIQISKMKDVLLVNTKNLFLKNIIGDHNLIPEVDQGGLNEATFLELKDCNSLKYLVDTTKEHVPHTALTNLMELSISGMEGLKMLCNGQFPKGFLQNLKRLKVGGCDQLQEVFRIDELFHTREENQARLLSNLEHLQLGCLPELRWIVKGSSHYFSLQSLKVVNVSECKKLKALFSPSLIQSLKHLQELSVEHCDELKDLFAELESDGEIESNSNLDRLCLPRLTTLRISCCGSLQYVIPVTLAQGLPQLENLVIDRCKELKTLFAEQGSDGEIDLNNNLHPLCLPKLESLYVCECPTLEFALPIHLAQGLPQLERVRVWNCLQLKQVFGVAKQQDEDVQHCINLPCLEFLRLYNLKNLRSFGPKNCPVRVPVLENLFIADCPHLMKFSIDQEVKDNEIHLKREVRLFAFKEFLCKTEHLSLKEIMDPENLQLFLYNMEENQAPLLQNLEYLKLKAMPELRWICKGPNQYVSLQSLKGVRIEECNKLESLFSSSLIPSLRLLEELRIRNCDNLKMVFTELESDDETKTSHIPCFPNLKTLVIIECPRLKYVLPLAPAQRLPCLRTLRLVTLFNLSSFCPKGYSIKAPALKNIKVIDCPEMSNFTIQQDHPLQSKNFEECTDDAESCHSQLRERSLDLEYVTIRDYEPLIQLPVESKSMSSLEKMKLYKLNWLQCIWKVPAQVVLTNLSKLEVCECNNLTYVFPIMLLPNLPKLTTLKILECERLEQIIMNDDMSASSSSKGHDKEEKGVKNDQEKLMFLGLQELCLEGLPQLISFSPVGYHLVFPFLVLLEIRGCSSMLTSFTVDSALVVHAKTKAPRRDDGSSSKQDIHWYFYENPTSLPQYVEEVEGISALK